jgi:hypothetical protein
MKTNLVIFGTDNYKFAIDSLIKSSKNFFDSIHVFSSKDIDDIFFDKNKEILQNKRGSGYWLWKPYFINKVLKSIDFGDVVFYVDAGNIFLGDPSFLYKKLEKNNGIILFDNRDGTIDGESAKNYVSCKRDCFVLMGCDEEKYIHGTHLNASYQIYQKNENTLRFIEEYLNFCENKQIITDEPNSFGLNYPGYYDHRHDQSVLSLIAIKNNITPLVDPSEWGNKCNCRVFNQIFLHHIKPDYRF